MIDEDLKRLLQVMQEDNATAQAETRRHFDVAVKNLEKRFDQLAEAIGTVDDKLDRHEIG
jgi:hypothetical protein